MRKITLALLILLSTQVFAAKNLVEVYILQNGTLTKNACGANAISILNNGIPEQTALNSKYYVQFTYMSQVPIYANNFNPYFDEGFTETTNTCTSQFGGDNTCVISGYYKPPKLGENRFRFWYRYANNTFYCNAYTQTTQYVGAPEITLSSDSTPFKTYYPSPEVPNARYVFKNVGSNIAVISNVMIDNKPTQASYGVVDTCHGASMLPSGTCNMTFGGWLIAGVHEFKITINYDGKQYVYSETVVVGDDTKIVACKIGSN